MSDSSQTITDLNIYCPECDYNLTGCTGDRCSWCGWEIDVDVLSAHASERPGVRRAGAILTSIIIGVGSMMAAASLISRASVIRPADWIAVMGVGIAAIGHLVLAGMSLTSGRHWPMRRTETANMIHIALWISIAMCVIGATTMLEVAPTTRVVRGVKVNGTFEFILVAFLYTLPGITLFMIRMVSFRPTPSERKRRVHKAISSLTVQGEYVPFMIDFIQRFAAEQLTQSWNESSRTKDQAIEAAILQCWETESALAKDQNRLLFNNELIRLNSVEATPDQLRFDFGLTSYRDFLGTNMHNTKKVLQVGQQYFANPLGISALIITSDGFLVFGLRSQRVAYHAGYIHSFGGLLEKSDQQDDGVVDVFGGIKRELNEELGIQDKDITDIFIIGMVRDCDLYQPELLFDVSINLSRKELLENFDPDRGEGEHTKLITLYDDPESTLSFLDYARGATGPIARCTTVPGIRGASGPSAWGATGGLPASVHDDSARASSTEFKHGDAALNHATRQNSSAASPIAPITQAALLIHGLHLWGHEWYEQSCYLLFGQLPPLCDS